MTAKQYAKKYANYKEAGSGMKALSAMIDELIKEMLELANHRCIRREESFNDLIKEFNIKANKINKLIGEPLVKDYFTLFADKAKDAYYTNLCTRKLDTES